MSGTINIISGFNVGAPYPIDYRMVASNITERNNIVHKYDGLRVFLTNTRETWIWNNTSINWEPDASGTIIGSGSTSYVPRWNSNQSLENSNLFNNLNKLGLNTTNPLGDLHIMNSTYGTASSLIFDVSSSSDGFIGYNSSFSYVNGPAAIDINKGSTSIIFQSLGNTSQITFNHRKPNDSILSTHIPKLTIGYRNSLAQYCNIINGSNARNYIVGNSSITPSIGVDLNGYYTDTSQDLLMVNGSFRSNSKYSKQTTHLNYSYNGSYLMSLSYYNNKTSSYNNTQTFNSSTAYLNPSTGTYQMLDEHELVVYNKTTGGNIKKLIFTLPVSPEIGREIVIDYIGGGLTHSTITTSGSLKNLSDVSIASIDVNTGERVKIVYIGGSSPTWQVVELVSNNQTIKNDITLLKSQVVDLSNADTSINNDITSINNWTFENVVSTIFSDYSNTSTQLDSTIENAYIYKNNKMAVLNFDIYAVFKTNTGSGNSSTTFTLNAPFVSIDSVTSKHQITITDGSGSTSIIRDVSVNISSSSIFVTYWQSNNLGSPSSYPRRNRLNINMSYRIN